MLKALPPADLKYLKTRWSVDRDIPAPGVATVPAQCWNRAAHTVRDMTRAPVGGMKASGILNSRPPRPPSFFHFLPPNLPLKRSAMSRASSMCCFWSAPAAHGYSSSAPG